jgi:hypothetical protein
MGGGGRRVGYDSAGVRYRRLCRHRPFVAPIADLRPQRARHDSCLPNRRLPEELRWMQPWHFSLAAIAIVAVVWFFARDSRTADNPRTDARPSPWL